MVVESSMESVIGSVGRLESSNNSVVVKTPVMDSAGLSVARALLDRVSRPTSVDAVDATMRRSCRSGGKSRSRSTEWWGTLSDPKGSTGSVSFWKVNDEGSWRVMM